MMRKLSIVLAVSLMVLVFACNAQAAANLLHNPGFENGLSDWDDLWGIPAELSSTVRHSGTFSVEKTVGSYVASQEYWSQVFQEVTLSANEPVYAGMYVKTTFAPAATARAGIMVEFLGADDEILGSTLQAQDIGGQTDWRLLEVTIQYAPSGTTKARLSGYVWAAKGDSSSTDGSAYFDDAVFSKEYKPPVAQGALLNPGFENGLTDWKFVGHPAAATTEVFHSGSRAAIGTVETVTQQDYWSQIYQEIDCIQGKKLIASVYVKTDFLARAKATAGMEIKLLRNDGKVLRTVTKKIGGNNDWRQLLIQVNKTNNNTAKARFSLFVYAPRGNLASLDGKAYFDDTSLVIK